MPLPPRPPLPQLPLPQFPFPQFPFPQFLWPSLRLWKFEFLLLFTRAVLVNVVKTGPNGENGLNPKGE